MKRQLLLVRSGLMADVDKKRIERSGLVIIETADFSGFKLLDSEILVSGDQFAIAALETLCEGSFSNEKFAKKILAAMKSNHPAPSEAK